MAAQTDESTPLVAPPRRSRGRALAAGALFAAGGLAALAHTRPAPAMTALDRLAPDAAADVDALCGAFTDPRIDYGFCSDKEAGHDPYQLQAKAYPAAAACAPSEAASDGATGFLWYRPCQWQAIAALPELCAGAFAPTPPAPADGVVSAEDKEALALMLDLDVAGRFTTPCQANAFCSSCYSDDGATNPSRAARKERYLDERVAGTSPRPERPPPRYCAAVLDQHPGLLASAVAINNPDTFFGELDYWCSGAVLGAIASGDELPPLSALYERGEVLVPGGADEPKSEKAPYGRRPL